MSEKTVKIEIELECQDKKAIDIIAKAFNWTPKQFIQYSIKKDIDFIQQYSQMAFINDLYEHYNIEKIDLEELKKLIFLEEIL